MEELIELFILNKRMGNEWMAINRPGVNIIEVEHSMRMALAAGGVEDSAQVMGKALRKTWKRLGYRTKNIAAQKAVWARKKAKEKS